MLGAVAPQVQRVLTAIYSVIAQMATGTFQEMVSQMPTYAQSGPDRLNGALKALEKTLAGEYVPFNWGDDLIAVEEFLGLKRPLASYAPRTRRRYIAAVRKNDRGAKRTLAKETQTRTARTKEQYGLNPSQLTQLNKVKKPIIESGVDIHPFLNDDVIKNTVKMYGFKYMLEVLSNQLDSIKRYTAGDPLPGRERWNSRGELEEAAKARLGSAFQLTTIYIGGTDPYYYYHGHYR